jgi:hypothetical protein
MITTTSILNQTVYGTASGNYDGSSQDWITDSVRAANYYQGRSGIQTITFDVAGFEGVMYLEATLDTVPETATWFNTFTFGDGSTTPVTDRHPETVIGNFTWMRVRVEGFSGGVINSVTISY